MLSAEGIEIDEIVPAKTQETIFDVAPETKIYKPKNSKCEASIIIQDGMFVLLKGSTIVRPPESIKDTTEGIMYARLNANIDKYLEDGKVVLVGNQYITQVDLMFKSPSSVANLLSGRSKNG